MKKKNRPTCRNEYEEIEAVRLVKDYSCGGPVAILRIAPSKM